MFIFNYRIIGLCLSFVLLLVLALSSSSIAFADSTTGTVSVNAGTLFETNATTPAVGATLNGTDQTPPTDCRSLRLMRLARAMAGT